MDILLLFLFQIYSSMSYNFEKISNLISHLISHLKDKIGDFIDFCSKAHNQRFNERFGAPNSRNLLKISFRLKCL